MSDAVIVTLSCSSCGVGLEITTDIEQFVCPHCGTQQTVRHGDSITSVQPLIQKIEWVQYDRDEVTAELEIRRLSEEIAQAKEQSRILEEMPPDEVIPPPTSEKLLPLIAIVSVVVGIFLANILQTAACGVMLLGPLLIFCYLYLLLVRRAKARTAKEARLQEWCSYIDELQQALEQNQRIVSA
jgi:predicted RNA-binding Zn-ribbon protein involved in translation (DUF1610 family)